MVSTTNSESIDPGFEPQLGHNSFFFFFHVKNYLQSDKIQIKLAKQVTATSITTSEILYFYRMYQHKYFALSGRNMQASSFV